MIVTASLLPLRPNFHMYNQRLAHVENVKPAVVTIIWKKK